MLVENLIFEIFCFFSILWILDIERFALKINFKRLTQRDSLMRIWPNNITYTFVLLRQTTWLSAVVRSSMNNGVKSDEKKKQKNVGHAPFNIALTWIHARFDTNTLVSVLWRTCHVNENKDWVVEMVLHLTGNNRPEADWLGRIKRNETIKILRPIKIELIFKLLINVWERFCMQ